MFQKRVAYFIPEIAIDPGLQTYAGGLGFVGGSFLRAAGREKFPMVGVTILWRNGFYDQRVGPNGMEVHYVDRYYDDILEDSGVRVKVQLGENPNVWIKTWLLKAEVQKRFKTAPILFLDADLAENDLPSRANTRILYPADNGRKLAGKIILGIGGLRALQALQMPINLLHLNEGYSLLAGVELIGQRIAEGFSFQEALDWAKERIVFTTHTPEMTGSEIYNLDTMIRMGCFPGLNRQEAAFLAGDPFNLTVALLRMSKIANAVSQLHAETANRLWAWVEGRCPIIPITNGQDVDYWQWPEFREAQTINEIKEAKLKQKRFLLDYIKEQTGKVFCEDVLTIVWARRFADYKRPWLIFYNQAWFEWLLRSGKVQIIFAGKPHPADLSMIRVWNEIWQMSQRFPNLVILPGYDLWLSKLLKGGADLWLQTPRRPREACSTSWMTAMMNCTLVISSRDGGMLEGISPENGFLFGLDYPRPAEGEQDAKDFTDLQQSLPLAIDIFYGNPNRWYQMAGRAKKDAGQKFSADRMMLDYVSRLYD